MQALSIEGISEFVYLNYIKGERNSGTDLQNAQYVEAYCSILFSTKILAI
jgi:hypothetical protein